MSILHFDAHGDLRDTYEGQKYSHACAARRWVELGIPSVHVGIRSISKEEIDYVRESGTMIVSNREMHRSDAWMEKALQKLTGEVYVTFDVDFFDGALVPATGTPEPGGGTYDQALSIIRRVASERRIIGADVVEHAPLAGNRAPDFMVAKLCYKMLGYAFFPEKAAQPGPVAKVSDCGSDTSEPTPGSISANIPAPAASWVTEDSVSTSSTDEKDLVARCREGNDDAWRELVDRFGHKVYAISYHFTLKREDAEELSQEIFLKLFENLHRYDGGFPLVAWILSVSRNLCIDRYRRRKREKSFRFVSDDAVTALLKSDDDPASMALKKERTQMLFSALADVPEDLAEILILRDLNGLAYDEIGKALELPEGTVKSRLFRARAEVARKIRERHESKGAPGALASLAIAAAGLV